MAVSFLIGLLAGGFGGLVGLGGGAVMIPLMVRQLGLSQHQAHGTSLMALVCTGLAGATTYALNGSVDVLAAVCLAGAGMLTAWVGAHAAHAMPPRQLRRAFGSFLVIVSVILVLEPYLSPAPHPVYGWHTILILLCTGALAGFISGLMGVGGGSIMVPAMVLLVGMGQHLAQGSALLAMVPAGAVGAIAHRRLGNVVTAILPGLIAGIILGTFLGGSLAHGLSDASLRLVFAVVLIGLGVRDIRSTSGIAAPAEAD